MNVHTVGGVVGVGATRMLIVQQEDVLIVKVQPQLTDMDQVRSGQAAVTRLPAFNQRSTPELTDRVTILSVDLTRDDTMGTSSYLGRLIIGEDEHAKIWNGKFVPGMPGTVFIHQTGARKTLLYLVTLLTTMCPTRLKHAMSRSAEGVP